MDAGQIRSQPEASQWEALPTSVYLRLCLARGEEAPCVCVCVWWWWGGWGALLSQSPGDGEGSTQHRD